MDPFTTAGLGMLTIAVASGALFVAIIGIAIVSDRFERGLLDRERASLGATDLLNRPARSHAV